MSRFHDIELPDWATVTASTAHDLAQLPDTVTNTTEAAIALALARKLDSGGEMSVAPVSKELREVMALLRTNAENQTGRGDVVDDLSDRFAARRAAAKAAQPGA
jgi:hypothetical protein